MLTYNLKETFWLKREIRSTGETATTGAKEPPEILMLELLRAYANWSGLQGLFVHYPATWNTPWTWGWVAFPEDADIELAKDHQAGMELNESAQKLGSRLFGLRLPLSDGRPHEGELLAFFSSQPTASAAEPDLRRLAIDLEYLLRTERQAADVAALRLLSTVPSGEEQAESDLREALELIRQRTNSDGAKVFAILSQCGIPMLWQFWNTDVQGEAPEPRMIEDKRGVADWVVRNKDWVLIPTRDPNVAAGEAEETCLTGSSGEVRIRARPETEYLPTHPDPDKERTMLFVPMASQGQVAGVLSIWRTREEAYTPGDDPEGLLHFAPLVEAACVRIFQSQKAREELDAIADLTREMNIAKSFPAAYQRIARGVGRLANAASTVLLLLDKPTHTLYMVSAWCADDAYLQDTIPALARLRFKIEAATTLAVLQETFRDCLPGFKLRCVIQAPSTNSGTQGPGARQATSFGKTPLLAILFDLSSAWPRNSFPADRLLDHFAESYLQSAWALLRDYSRSLAERVVDELGSSLAKKETRVKEVLAQAAKLLQVSTGAEAVLLYTGTPQQMRLRSALPSIDPRSLPSAPGLHTGPSLQEGSELRVLDADLDGGDLDLNTVEAFKAAFGWRGLGSWLCCPLVYQRRTIGLIKLLTSDQGPFLGQDQALLSRAVADRTTVELQQARVAQQVEELLKLTTDMTQYHGAKLGGELVTGLRTWLRSALDRAHCEVAVIAFTPKDTRILVSEATPRLHESISDLEALSMRANLKAAVEPKRPSARILTGRDLPGKHLRGVQVPITLPGERRLAGDVFAFDHEEFYADDLETLQRAAHYIAFVLDTERERSTARLMMGRFRHAMLGPVQGLTSAAKYLLRKTASALPPLEDQKLSALLLKESENLRQWRENQRFYLADRIQLRKRRFALRRLVDQCIERFQPIAADRGISIVNGFAVKGELQIEADEAAVDLALSNLLDNACKYSFSHQVVTVGARVNGHTVHLWVEDIGHPVPQSIRDVIYESGRRGVEHDPFRLILGQGLGLAMARLAATAHDGQLTHSCELAYVGKKPETSGYRVRFTLELPWGIVR